MSVPTCVGQPISRAARSNGVGVRPTKLVVYVFTAFCTGMAGALIFLQRLRISPDAGFSVNDWTALVIFMTVIGGVGSIEGPILGTIVFFALRETLSSLGSIYLMILGAVAIGTLLGGPIGDRIGRKYVIRGSILGVLPFTLLLPLANLFWTGVLTVFIGLIIASAFPAILVYAQELVVGRLGMISGVFFGLAFGLGGIGAAVLGQLADHTSIDFVYRVCSFLPLIGVLTWFLPEPGKESSV